MENSTILLSSVTWALRAQKLLEQQGTRSIIRKISHHPRLSGCGYGLEVRGDTHQALSLLAAAEIRIIDVI